MSNFEEKYAAVQEMIANMQHTEARDELQRLVAEHGDNAVVHFDLGNLYYADEQMDKALLHYEKCAQLASDNPVYLKNYADLLYSEKKDVDGALAHYEQILVQRPEDIQSLMMTGHLCVSLKRFDQAATYYDRVLELEPWNAEAQQFLDRVKAHTGTHPDTISPEQTYERCQELVRSGRTQEAIRALEELVDHDSAFALAYNDLGVLYYHQNQKDKSLQCYEKATSLDPENTNFRKNIADFYIVEQGQIERALEIYLAVLTDNPEDIDALMVAGHICSSLGKTDSARLFYDRVLDVEPWNLEASERLESLQSQTA